MPLTFLTCEPNDTGQSSPGAGEVWTMRFTVSNPPAGSVFRMVRAKLGVVAADNKQFILALYSGAGTGAALLDWAVMTQTIAQSGTVIEQLLPRNVPCVAGTYQLAIIPDDNAGVVRIRSRSTSVDVGQLRAAGGTFTNPPADPLVAVSTNNVSIFAVEINATGPPIPVPPPLAGRGASW